MQITEISYTESIKKPTGTKYESKFVSVSAKMEIQEQDNLADASRSIKEFVKSELKKEIEVVEPE